MNNLLTPGGRTKPLVFMPKVGGVGSTAMEKPEDTMPVVSLPASSQFSPASLEEAASRQGSFSNTAGSAFGGGLTGVVGKKVLGMEDTQSPVYKQAEEEALANYHNDNFWKSIGADLTGNALSEVPSFLVAEFALAKLPAIYRASRLRLAVNPHDTKIAELIGSAGSKLKAADTALTTSAAEELRLAANTDMMAALGAGEVAEAVPFIKNAFMAQRAHDLGIGAIAGAVSETGMQMVGKEGDLGDIGSRAISDAIGNMAVAPVFRLIGTQFSKYAGIAKESDVYSNIKIKMSDVLQKMGVAKEVADKGVSDGVDKITGSTEMKVPKRITTRMYNNLKELGFEPKEIRKLTPKDAMDLIIEGKKTAELNAKGATEEVKPTEVKPAKEPVRILTNEKELTDTINEFKTRFPSTKDIQILAHKNIDEAIASKTFTGAIPEDSPAFADLNNGKIHIIMDRTTPAELSKFLVHEGVGHIMSRAILKGDFRNILMAMIRENRELMMKNSLKYADVPSYRMSDGKLNMLKIAEEGFVERLIAEVQKPVELQQTWFKRFIARIKDWFDKVTGRDTPKSEVEDAIRRVVAESKKGEIVPKPEDLNAPELRFARGEKGVEPKSEMDNLEAERASAKARDERIYNVAREATNISISLRRDLEDGWWAKSNAASFLSKKLPAFLGTGSFMHTLHILDGMGATGQKLMRSLYRGIEKEDDHLFTFFRKASELAKENKVTESGITKLAEDIEIMAGDKKIKTNKMDLLNLWMALNDADGKYSNFESITKKGYQFKGSDGPVSLTKQQIQDYSSQAFLAKTLGPEAANTANYLRSFLDYMRNELNASGKLEEHLKNETYWPKLLSSAERDNESMYSEMLQAAKRAERTRGKMVIPDILLQSSENRLRRGNGAVMYQNPLDAVFKHAQHWARNLAMGQELKQLYVVADASADSIVQKAGKGAYESLMRNLKASMGEFNNTGSEGRIFSKIMQNYVRSALSFNLTSVITQPVALLQALNHLDDKAYSVAMANFAQHMRTGGSDPFHKWMMENVPTYMVRYSRAGFSPEAHDLAISNHAENILFGSTKISEAMKRSGVLGTLEATFEKGMNGMSEGDAATLRVLYKAVQDQVARENPGRAPSELLKLTNSKFTDVVNDSQATIHPLTRSANQNTPGVITRLSSVFMSQAIKTMSTLMRDIGRYQAETDPVLKAQLGKALMRNVRLFGMQSAAMSAIGVGGMFARNAARESLMSDSERKKFVKQKGDMAAKSFVVASSKILGTAPLFGQIASDMIAAAATGQVYGSTLAIPGVEVLADLNNAAAAGGRGNIRLRHLIKMLNDIAALGLGAPREGIRLEEATLSNLPGYRK